MPARFHRPMRILIVTPAPPRSRYGNRVTALRWARILRGLGHRVTLVQTYQGQPCGLLIALHAVRSHAAVRTFRLLHPTRPVVVALTGTDIYRDLPKSKKGVETLEAASRLVALNSKAQERLPPRLRGKVRVIFQSAQVPSGTPPGLLRGFDV
ncbi:MAG: TIGR04348 family glycosyltransferase, partial [SAR324 cluster bacterium]|nr:TIGR04348 family glycosyltransferase [SAR324 cluster bacterium]